MIVFSTRIPLKNEASVSTCIELFKKWIIGSPHYAMDISDLSEENLDGYFKEEDESSFSGMIYEEELVKISAVQLRHKDQKESWCTDCLVIEEAEKKYLLVQLDYRCEDYSGTKPRPHKPYVIRLFISSGLCDNDWVMPIDERYLIANNENFNTCLSVMNGISDNLLPVVYVSCDDSNQISIDYKALAKRLAGIAHVIVEKDHKIGLKLKSKTKSNNVFGGYVGVYYPRSKDCEKYSSSCYVSTVVQNVQRALVYRSEYTEYSWNQVMIAKSRRKFSDLETTSQKEMNDFLEYYDADIEDYKQRIKELNERLQRSQAMLEQYKYMYDLTSEKNKPFYLKGSEPEFYPGEYSDLLYYVLTDVLTKKSEESRSYRLINSLLKQNPCIGNAAACLDRIRDILAYNEKLSQTHINELESLGFKIIGDKKHSKFIFHDPRYEFPLAKTASDYREPMNYASDVMKIIDIRK